MRDYYGILGQCSHEYIVSRSRFIATASMVRSQEEAVEFVREVSKRYSDATHNCYAYISNPEMTEMKFSDANEPQGTAGQPILEVLKKRKLACSAVVVTRYYGGVKLGTGGLVAAYTKVTKECLEMAHIVHYKLSDYYTLRADYTYKNKLEQAIKATGGEVVDTIYLGEVEITYAVPIGNDKVEQAILSVTSGQVRQELLYRKYYIYK